MAENGRPSGGHEGDRLADGPSAPAGKLRVRVEASEDRTAVARLRAAGVQLYAKQVRDEKEFASWVEEREQWSNSVVVLLGSRFGEATPQVRVPRGAVGLMVQSRIRRTPQPRIDDPFASLGNHGRNRRSRPVTHGGLVAGTRSPHRIRRRLLYRALFVDRRAVGRAKRVVG